MTFGKLVVPRAPEVVDNISGDNLSRGDTNENLRHHVSSGLENELFLTNGVPETAPSSSLEPGACEEGSAPYSFSWGDSLPSQRRLAAESLSLFVCLHRSLALTDRWEVVKTWSQKMGELLRDRSAGAPASSADEQMEDVVDVGDGGEEVMLQRQMMSAVWKMVEICYVEDEPGVGAGGAGAAEALVGWLLDHDALLSPQDNTIAARKLSLQDRLIAVEFPEDEEQYWEGIVESASVGWMDVAIQLLRMHGSYRQDQLPLRTEENGVVEAVVQLLAQMPWLNPKPQKVAGTTLNSFTSLPQYAHERTRWLRRLSGLASLGAWQKISHQRTEAGLGRLLAMLQGSREILRETARNWMEGVVGRCLHLDGANGGLRSVGAIARKYVEGGPPLPPFESMVLAALEHSTEELVSEASRFFDSWMVFHLLELIRVGGSASDRALVEAEEGHTLSLRERYCLEYVQHLASHPATWQVAPAYAATCPTKGRGVLEAILIRVANQGGSGSKTVYKALEICRQYDLASTSASICQTQGALCWERGNCAAAVAWFRRGKDDAWLRAVADAVVKGLGGAGGEAAVQDACALMEEVGEELGGGAEDVLGFLQRFKDLTSAVAELRRGCEEAAGESEKVVKKAVKCLLELLEPGGVPPELYSRTLECAVWREAVENLVEKRTTVIQDLLSQGDVALLEWPEGVLVGSEHTQEIMSQVQYRTFLEDAHPREGEVGRKRPRGEQMQRLTHALTSNLGRAIMCGR